MLYYVNTKIDKKVLVEPIKYKYMLLFKVSNTNTA